ncbi:hypothetical protein ACVW17_004960 [Bradyrhizobium sp. USDA 4473]
MHFLEKRTAIVAVTGRSRLRSMNQRSVRANGSNRVQPALRRAGRSP